MNEDGLAASVTAIRDRLFAEFAQQVPPAEIEALLGQCQSDLDAVPRAAMPELVERLARERLLSRLPAAKLAGDAMQAEGIQ